MEGDEIIGRLKSVPGIHLCVRGVDGFGQFPSLTATEAVLTGNARVLGVNFRVEMGGWGQRKTKQLQSAHANKADG